MNAGVTPLLAPTPEGGNRCSCWTRREMVYVNRDAYDFYHDFKVGYETMAALPVVKRPALWLGSGACGRDGPRRPSTDPRRGQMLYALNRAATIFDDGDPATIAPAREALQEILGRKNGDTVHQVFGHRARAY